MKNIKSLMLTLILGLGVILSISSCSKQEDWNEIENVSIDCYQEGIIFVELHKYDGSIKTKVLEPGQRLDFKRSEFNAVIAVGLDDFNKARFHGNIKELYYNQFYIWYLNENNKTKVRSAYLEFLDCVNKSDGSDSESEGCQMKFDIEW